MVPSFQIRGEKHHRFTVTRKSRIESALLGRPHPVAEDLMEKPVSATPGPVEDEAANPVRVRERELLRDRAPHGRPDYMRPLELEGVHQCGGVGCEVGDPKRPFGRG